MCVIPYFASVTIDSRLILCGVIYASLLGGMLLYASWTNKRIAAARGVTPLIDPISRPPGESLRLKINDLNDKLNDMFIILVPLIMFACMTPFYPFPYWSRVVVFSMILVAFVVTLRRYRGIKETRDNYVLGFEGERFVGQWLNELLKVKYNVFHDLKFGKKGNEYNIDHVVIGPSGVYAIETKTRRKPKHISGKEKATVVFDGTCLAFPTFTDKYGIEQAVKNAKTLSEALSSSTGEVVRAKPVLTLPGWFVKRAGNGELLVMNPKELVSALQGKRTLADEQLQRIKHQLTQMSTAEG